MKKRFVAGLLILAVLILAAPAHARSWTDIPFAGSGTDQSPYQIQSAEDLFTLAELVNNGMEFRGVYFTQTRDIDLEGKSWTPIGSGSSEGAFFGVYDGDAHTIERLVCTQEAQAGLFGTLCGQVCNLSIGSGALKGELCGGIAACIGEGVLARIINCSNMASVAGNIAGGIVGQAEPNTVIASCWSDCPVTGEYTDGITPSDCAMLACMTTLQSGALQRARSLCEYLTPSELHSESSMDTLNRQLPIVTRYVGVDTHTLCRWAFNDGRLQLSAVHCTDRYLLDGKGTEASPYLISNKQDLRTVIMMAAAHMLTGQYLYQTRDIDLSGVDWEPIGSPEAGTQFKGTYDGGGHVIRDLRCENSDYAGFIGVLSGKVINLGLENVSLSGNVCGAIAASGNGATRSMILNCYSTGSIDGNIAGGIAGDFPNGDVRGCWSDCTLNGETAAGIVAEGAHSATFCATTAPNITADVSTFTKETMTLVQRDALASAVDMLNSSILYSTNLSDIPAANFYMWEQGGDAPLLSSAQFRMNGTVLQRLFAMNRSKLIKLAALGVVALGALILLCVYLRRETKRRGQGLFSMLRPYLKKFERWCIVRENRVLLILIAVCLILFGACYAMLHLPVSALLLFVAFIVFYTLLPGYILARRFCEYDSAAMLYTLCSFGSIALLIAEYILCSFLKDFRLITLCGPVLSCVSVYLLARDRKRGLLSAAALRPELPLCVLCAAVTLLVFAIRAFKGASPALTGSITLFKDSLYIAENSAALMDGLFATRIDMPGFPYRYHIVSNVLQACAMRVAKTSAVDTYMTYWTLFYIPLSCISLYTLFMERLRSVKRTLLCILVTLFTSYFTFAIFHLSSLDALRQNLDMTMPGLWTYLMLYPNGIDIAIPALVAAAFVALRVYGERCALKRALLLFLLLTFIATGAKLTFGLCLLGALCGTLLLALLQGKKRTEFKLPALLLLCCAVGFIASYFTFIYNPMPSSGSSLSMLFLTSSDSTVRASKLFSRIVDQLAFIGLPLGDTALSVLTLILLPLSVFCLLPFTMPAYVIWMGEQLKRFKQISYENMLLCGVSLCGLLALYLTSFAGFSQFYFIFGAFPFIQLLGFSWIADHYKSMKRGWCAVFAVLLVIGLFHPLNDAWLHLDISRNTIAKIRTPSLRGTTADHNRLTAAEYEAMLWLRENTPQDTVLAVNRHNTAYVPEDTPLFENDDACYFYYGAYSQRHLFLGGYAYRSDTPEMREWLTKQNAINEAFFAPDTRERTQLMRDNGVSYLVVSKLPTGHNVIRDSSLTELFANGDIRIYGIAE